MAKRKGKKTSDHGFSESVTNKSTDQLHVKAEEDQEEEEDGKNNALKPCPLLTANCLSKITFW